MVSKAQKKKIETIRRFFYANPRFMEASLIELFDHQTIDEKSEKRTKHNNAMGFNKPDANILTDFSIWILNGRILDGEFLDEATDRMMKYANQLSAYENTAGMMGGERDPDEVIREYQQELRYPTIIQSTIDEWVDYRECLREEERERRRRERREKKRQDRRLSRLQETCKKVVGNIVEIRRKALKMYVPAHEMEHWIPKFAIKEEYSEEIGVEQDFWITKKIATQKERNAIENAYIEIVGRILEAREKALKILVDGRDYWIPKFATRSGYEETEGIEQSFFVRRKILAQKQLV